MSCTPSLFGVLDNWWVVTHRRHIFAFHWYQWVGNKTFSHRLCTGYQKKNSCLWLWLCPCYKVPEFSRHPSLLLAHKTVEIHCTWLESWCTLGITEKQSRFCLAWSCPCTNQDQTEPTRVFCAASDLCQVSSKYLNNGGWKKLFLTHNRGWPLANNSTETTAKIK